MKKTKRYCDRCKEEVKARKKPILYKLGFMSDYHIGFGIYYLARQVELKKYDLCINCQDSFNNWFEAYEKTKER